MVRMDTSQHETTEGMVAERVLVVDDEPDLVELYGKWLDERYEVVRATSGADALEAIDERIDVVLLDRDMPERSGSEVLTEINDRELDCATAMITGVEPDVDILDMRFDEYVRKPVRRGQLLDIVALLSVRREYESKRRRSYELASKKAVLEAAHDRSHLEDNEEYQQLRRDLETLERELQANLEELLDRERDAAVLYRGLDGAPGDSSSAAKLS